MVNFDILVTSLAKARASCAVRGGRYLKVVEKNENRVLMRMIIEGGYAEKVACVYSVNTQQCSVVRVFVSAG